MDNKDIALRYFNPAFASRDTIREAMVYAYSVANGTDCPALVKKAVHTVHNTFLANVVMEPGDDLITPDPEYPVHDTVKDAVLHAYELVEITGSAPWVITAIHVMLNSLARNLYPDIEDEFFPKQVKN
ncbi:MAG: hypothetical protein EBR94_11790 [Bacteroidetes bacterium]|nr:hypothetical protein [Bacteroidota bacterium]